MHRMAACCRSPSSGRQGCLISRYGARSLGASCRRQRVPAACRHASWSLDRWWRLVPAEANLALKHSPVGSAFLSWDYTLEGITYFLCVLASKAVSESQC